MLSLRGKEFFKIAQKLIKLGESSSNMQKLARAVLPVGGQLVYVFFRFFLSNGEKEIVVWLAEDRMFLSERAKDGHLATRNGACGVHTIITGRRLS